ncbi:hypothetical protein [Actinomadura hibisca]|uniref:hypothetical protein n=1 Tax=Actinomadura hibisca TaxID=68565 RepID=UPI00082E88C4|nr:hypothetical protein [Actinomadura hibisca]
MNLRDAVRMVLAESAAFPELLRVTRHAYEELDAGRPVPHTSLSWLLREAARKGVYSALVRKHGTPAFNEMVTVLGKEIDRQAPAPIRRPSPSLGLSAAGA